MVNDNINRFTIKLMYIIQFLNCVSELWKHRNVYRTMAVDIYNRRLLRYLRYLNEGCSAEWSRYLGLLTMSLDPNNFLEISEFPEYIGNDINELENAREIACEFYEEIITDLTTEL